MVGPVAPARTPNVYEFRNYRTKPGAVRQWAGLMTKVLPAREKYSKIVGLWITEAAAAQRGLPHLGLQAI